MERAEWTGDSWQRHAGLLSGSNDSDRPGSRVDGVRDMVLVETNVDWKSLRAMVELASVAVDERTPRGKTRCWGRTGSIQWVFLCQGCKP